MIISDAIVISATWLRMHRQAKEALTVRIHSSLSTVMLTDGPCAFIVDDRSGLPMYFRQFVFSVSVSMSGGLSCFVKYSTRADRLRSALLMLNVCELVYGIKVRCAHRIIAEDVNAQLALVAPQPVFRD